MIAVGEEDVGEVNFPARDVDRLESVDGGLVEAIDVVVVGCADDGGKGRLGFREEIFCVLGGGRCADAEEMGAQGLPQ